MLTIVSMSSKILLHTVVSVTLQMAGIFMNILEKIWNWLQNCHLNTSFLSDTAAFQAVIIALLIPLSIEIISKISERYKSDVITKSFTKSLENKIFPYILLFNIALTISLKMFINDKEAVGSIIRIIVFVVYGGLIFSIYLTWKYIRHVKKYMTNINEVLNALYGVIRKALFKTSKKSQQKFIEAFEGVGDILVYETKRLKNDFVFRGLQDIESIAKYSLALRHKNKSSFDKIVFSEEFLSYLKNDNKWTASAMVSFYPEKVVKGFHSLISQISRIAEAAMDSRNDEVCRNSNWVIKNILEEISNKYEYEYEIFADYILRRIFTLFEISIKKQSSNAQMFGYLWYFSVVFSRGKSGNNFDIEYLNLFNRYLFSNLCYAISSQQRHIFRSFIAAACDRVSDTYVDISRYNIFIHKNTQIDEYIKDKSFKLIRELESMQKNIDSKVKFDKWLASFDELYNITNKDDNTELKEFAKKTKESISEVYKDNSFLDIIIALGAFCLFKEDYENIKYMLEYEQPKDADANWTGTKIIQDSMPSLIELFLKLHRLVNRFYFWEGRRGSSVYFNKYFIILVAYVFDRHSLGKNKGSSIIETFNLSDTPARELRELIRLSESFAALSERIKTENYNMHTVIFDNRYDDILKYKLLPFFNKLKSEATKQLDSKNKSTKLSPEKIRAFKDDFLKSFKGYSGIREIFVFFSSYEEKLNEINNKDLLVISECVDKAVFFDQWYISYSGYASPYAQSIVQAENTKILEEVSNKCKNINVDSFEMALENIKNIEDIIILLSTHLNIMKLYSDKSFIHRHRVTTEDKFTEVSSFVGYYKYNDILIPIFVAVSNQDLNQILFLDKSKFGKIVQFSPVSPVKKEDPITNVEDIFCIDIYAYTENEAALDRLLNSPPEWLTKYGNREKQNEFLQTQALIDIQEKFEYVSGDDFKGYSLKVKSD